jgi:hypothetical protein
MKLRVPHSEEHKVQVAARRTDVTEAQRQPPKRVPEGPMKVARQFIARYPCKKRDPCRSARCD